MEAKEKYLEAEYVGYSLDRYTRLLCHYIAKRFLKWQGNILDVGCGRGYHCAGFILEGFNTDGIDRDKCDFERDAFPIPENSYDYVFTKSTLEHIWNTQHLLNEIYRVLKPKGKVICLTPAWERQTKCFWDDSTHIKPFTSRGLKQAFGLAGFKNISCELFYQFPLAWDFPWLKFIYRLIALIIPDKFKWKGKRQRVLIRHSKEPMLLLSASK